MYTVYKDQDDEGKYYMDAYDASPSVAELNGIFESDEEAISWAQRFLDNVEE